MKLVKISARNLKGCTFSLDLKSIAVLVGSNFAGKSARADAIRLLFLGHLPELGKLPRSTFEIASGREMVVEGEFDDGTKLSRRWYVKDDVVKATVAIEADLKRKDGNDADRLLDAEDRFATMLDASTYFSLSERERVAYVFENVAAAEEDGEPPEMLLFAAERELRTEDPAACKRFTDGLHDAKNKRQEEGGFWTHRTLIDFALEHATEEAKLSRSRATTFEKTAHGLAHLRAADAAPESLGALETTLAKLRAALGDLQTKKGGLLAAFAQGRANQRRRDDLASQVRAKPSFTAQRETFRVTIERLTAERDAIPAVSDEEVDALRTEEVDARGALRQRQAELQEATASITRNEEELAGLDAKTSCPFCGATGDGWKALRRAEIESALAGLKAKGDQLAESVFNVRAHAERLEARLCKLKVNRALRLAKDRELQTAEDSLETVEKNLAVLDAKEEQLAAIPREDPALTAEVETLQAEINVKNGELHAVEDRRRKAIGRDYELTRLAEAEKGRDDAKADLAAATLAATIFRKAKAAAVEEAFRPLLEAANRLCGPILRSPLAYKDGEIGTWRDGLWVGHRTFSGTEKALAYAAIQAALSAKLPVRIVLIDELGRLDDANATKLLRAAQGMIERGEIDNFVGIDVGRGLLYTNEAEMHGADLTLAAIS